MVCAPGTWVRENMTKIRVKANQNKPRKTRAIAIEGNMLYSFGVVNSFQAIWSVGKKQEKTEKNSVELPSA